MTKLHLIAGITPDLQRRLEMAGVATVESLARQDPGKLVQRINQQTAGKAAAGESVVSRKELENFIHLSQAVVGMGATPGPLTTEAVAGDLPVNLDQVPEAIVVRPDSRSAAASPSAPFMHGHTTPSASAGIPAKAVLSAGPATAARGVTRVADGRRKFRDFKEYSEGKLGVEPLQRKPAEDEEEVEGALRKFNYQPGEPVPRGVRRGVPHPRPFFLVFSSLIVLAVRLLTLIVAVGTPLVLWPAFTRGETSPLLNFLWVIAAWAVSGILYLTFAVRARCRVCTNHIFWSKRCTKNAKAHRVPGLGLTGSMALHALLFGWFRCMYCGTAIRLKFVSDPERSA